MDRAAWSSPWRTRAVRDKAILSVGLLACALVLPPWPGGVAAGVVAVAVMVRFGGVPWSTVGRCLSPAAVFIGLGALPVLVSVSWGGWGSPPALAVTGETARTAGALAVRGFAGASAVFVLATTTPMIDLLTALRRLRVPDPCIEVAALTYRLVFVLLESAWTVNQAQVARLGYASRSAALRSAAAAVAAILTSSWDRAARLEDGLAGRGYLDALPTLDPERRTSTRFVALSLLVVALIAAVGIGASR